jgi:hypothetical protein
MAKVLRVVATVASAVALVAGVVTANPALIGLGAKGVKVAGTVAAVAGVAAAVAGIGAQLLAPKPIARGSPAQVIIDVEPPRPYIVGETFFGGVMRYRDAYGPTLKKVPNPYYAEVKVFSGVGPVEALVQEQFDFAAIGSYFNGFYSSVSQLGLRPEPAALVPPLNAPMPGWDSTSKLSGCAAILSNYKFDPDGQRFAGAMPVHGAIWRGEKVYSRRDDSTAPGGDGPCRLGDESTYIYSRNPADHFATYCYGRFENGELIFGLGLPSDAIDWTAIVDWANDCDANEWTANGVLFEGGQGADIREQRKRNMDDLCAAGAARWFEVGGYISVDWQRPRVPLFTITDDDLLEAGAGVDGNQSIRDRMNGVVPQYIEPANNWQQVSASEIVGSTYRDEDGQRLTQTWPLNLVTDKTQAGQIAAYAMADSREAGPFDMTLKPAFRFWRPGDCGTIDSEILNYTGDAVIAQRGLDPAALSVSMVLKSETPGKHDFALGKTAVPPPVAIIGLTQEERDAIAARSLFVEQITVRFRTPTFPFTPGDGQLDIAEHTSVLSDTRTINFPARLETGLDTLTQYRLFWDLVAEDYVFEPATMPTEITSRQFIFLTTFQTSSGSAFPPPPPPPPSGIIGGGGGGTVIP